MRDRARFLAPVLLLGVALAPGACGDDEAISGNPPTNDAGTDVSVDAPTVDSGLDKGPLGEQVPITETRTLTGLKGSVNAVRDKYGTVHIYARDFEDAFRVQGFLMALDRAGQLEIARRLATGRLGEVFATADPGQVVSDLSMRTIGLHRAAKAMYDALDPQGEAKRALDAFADGISQHHQQLRAGKLALAQSLAGFPPEIFSDWSPIDTLAMARLQTFSLSYDANPDISASGVYDDLTSTFTAGASDPDVAARAGLPADLFRWAPPATNTPLPGFPDESALSDSRGKAGGLAPLFATPHQAKQASKPSAVRVPPAALQAARPFLDAIERVQDFVGGDEFAGSNNWAVAGAKSAGGHALVANDPHLGLSSPMVFWPTRVIVDDADDPSQNLEIAGLAFPGIPGIILGTNRHLAWGATTTGYDVTDVWKETVSSDGTGVMFKGQKVPFQKITETLKLADQAPYTWDVLVVPHHGPIVPTISGGKVVPPTAGGTALSARWTGHEPTGEIEAVFKLMRAQTVQQGRAAMVTFGAGAQNWMMADSKGSIGWTAPARLPYRDKKAYTWDPATATGTLPCLVLDGASGDHEWTGSYLEEQYQPKLLNPAKGWIATANTDNVASVVDNDPSNDKLPNGQPFFIGCDFAMGFRLARIEERLAAEAQGITPEGMAAIQADHKSALGARLSKHLFSALARAEQEKATPGTHADLSAVVQDARYAAANVPDLVSSLKQWETDGFLASAGINLDDDSLNVDAKEAQSAKATVIFNAWIVRAVGRVLEDELKLTNRTNIGTQMTLRAFIHLLEQDPTKLATYDATTQDSLLFDDITTTGVKESRDDRLVTALLDAVDDLVKIFGTDRNTWRWGALHRIRFKSLNPLWFVDIPPVDDPVFPDGFPRHGDQWNVDASNFSITRPLASPLSFSYGSGPVQRFVAEMTPTGPKIWNALPGGAVLATSSPHFRDEAEYWRKNENHSVPFETSEMLAALPVSPQHTLYTP